MSRLVPARRRVLAALAAVLVTPQVPAPSRAAGFAARPSIPLRILSGGTETVLRTRDLSAMPQRSVKAVTPWTEGVVTFSGVPFETLAREFGGDAGRVTLKAINAYKITLEVPELLADEALLAIRMNGRPMPVRDKGPIWLVFPSARRPELAHADNVHRWIWQIDEIDFSAH